jgi:hypothetical protein
VCRASTAIVDGDEERVQDGSLVYAQCGGSTGLRSRINLSTCTDRLHQHCSRRPLAEQYPLNPATCLQVPVTQLGV